ncbi:DMT family transporter [Paraburkholderia sp. MMS20-SJTR3]|uniref:DMT family transporter n=1 Tax=Paraburkholderia sejongensis TaxID=2886946 RepID=A0ABS8JSA8_9BURK|nr:DMT family transporter [Paraburkholderia sp. MMS20-SJTR3]MCC8392634.1 DMT family transporter [Paraburkholderia sp. MMS20-SJTR3]
MPPLLWAGNFIVGRALRTDVPPMTLAFARHLLALVCVLPFAWNAMLRDAGRLWQARWLVVRTSLTGLAGFNLCVYAGLHSTAASNALLLNSTIPVLIALLGAAFYRQRLGATQWCGMLVSSIGVLTIIAHGEIGRLVSLQFSSGDLTVFFGMVLFALYSLWLRQLPAKLNPMGLLGWQLVVAAAALLPCFGWEYASGHRAQWHLASLAGIGYVAVFTSVFATFLYTSGVAKVGPARAGLFIHLIPVYGAILSRVLLGETIQLYHVAGIAVIILGLLCANMRRSHAARPAAQPAARPAATPR